MLRRLTGGTGVIHRGDLGVGLALPMQHPWAKGIVRLYGRFLDVLGPALRSLGSEVSRLADPAHASRVRSPICFLNQLSDTLVVDGKKVVGCAQTRRSGAVLIHAAILLGLDAELYARVADFSPFGLADLNDALGLEARSCPLEPLPERYLEPFQTPRWSPVAAGGRAGGIPHS